MIPLLIVSDVVRDHVTVTAVTVRANRAVTVASGAGHAVARRPVGVTGHGAATDAMATTGGVTDSAAGTDRPAGTDHRAATGSRVAIRNSSKIEVSSGPPTGACRKRGCSRILIRSLAYALSFYSFTDSPPQFVHTLTYPVPSFAGSHTHFYI